ncbi:hypothetical protein REPUB_Repub13aG0151300 [Reevesia pubescens]
MKAKKGSDEIEPKPISEWTNAEVKKIQINFKKINTLHCALNPTTLDKISTCKSAKKIWDKLRITHEGIIQVKKSKIAFL